MPESRLPKAFTPAAMRSQLSILELIHRGDEGFIPFLQKDSGKMRSITSLELAELPSLFPSIMAAHARNLFFGLNTWYTAGRKDRHGRRFVLRKEKFLRYLNCCYVDCDVGRSAADAKHADQTKSVKEAFGRIVELQDACIIPPASILARSGRGLYAIWLLQADDDDFLPPRAWPEKRALYKRINTRLQAKLAGFAPDEIKDAARVLRVPGSFHGGTGQQVAYWPQVLTSGEIAMYTLKELAGLLGIAVVPERDSMIAPFRQPYGRQTKEPGSAPGRVAGRIARARKRIADFHLFEQAHVAERGYSWPQGGRRRALLYYTSMLYAAENTEAEILQAITAAAMFCDPPYPSDETDCSLAAIVSDPKIKNMPCLSDAELLRALDVSPAMIADHLDCIQSIGLPAEIKKQRQQAKKEFSSEIHRAIFRLIKRHGPKNLSCREIAKHLKRQGVELSHERARQVQAEILSDPAKVQRLKKFWLKKGRP